MELGLESRRFLVVGATGGIGEAVSRALVGEGLAGLALGVRDLAAGHALAARLDACEEQLQVVQCDLGVDFDPDRFVDEVEAVVGPLDGVVMCAGDPPWGGLGDVTDADWERALDVMLMGSVRVVRALLPRLVDRGWGRIVLVGGLNGRKPAGGSVISGVVCAGLASLATAVAKGAVASGVTVNVVDPHLTDTPRWRRQVEGVSERLGISVAEAESRLLTGVPRGRPVPPEDVAHTIVFLLSERASSIAGSAIAVDGALAPSLY
jgi:3-oxoacyl-[acyl-carrier protein] reductase